MKPTVNVGLEMMYCISPVPNTHETVGWKNINVITEDNLLLEGACLIPPFTLDLCTTNPFLLSPL